MNRKQFKCAKKALKKMKNGGVLTIPKEVTTDQLNELIRLASDNTAMTGIKFE